MAEKVTVNSSITSYGTFRSLLRVFGLVKRVMEPYFTAFGISGSQWAVLMALHRAKAEGSSGLWLKDIGERLLVRPPSVTGVVDRLLRLGLVARETSSTDSRARQVSLTPAGCEMVERILEGHEAKINDILSGLNPDEQKQLNLLLGRIGSHLEKIAQCENDSTVF